MKLTFEKVTNTLFQPIRFKWEVIVNNHNKITLQNKKLPYTNEWIRCDDFYQKISQKIPEAAFLFRIKTYNDSKTSFAH